jgi:GAF domain-containing protein
VVGDVLAEPDYRLTDETRSVRSEACIPVWAGDRLWGVLDVEEEQPSAFGEDEVRLLMAVGDQLGAALLRIDLADQLARAGLGRAT